MPVELSQSVPPPPPLPNSHCLPRATPHPPGHHVPHGAGSMPPLSLRQHTAAPQQPIYHPTPHYTTPTVERGGGDNSEGIREATCCHPHSPTTAPPTILMQQADGCHRPSPLAELSSLNSGRLVTSFSTTVQQCSPDFAL